MTASERYSGGAIVLHWLMAFLLAGEIGLGMAMPRGVEGFELYQLHKSIGITLLFLTLLRIGWRLTHRSPPALETGPGAAAARAVHAGFYALMLALPLSGWVVVSTAEIRVPTLLFGLVPWPHLPLSQAWAEQAELVHEWLAWAAIGLFVLHVAGALRHHLLLRDGLLARMAPARSPAAALFLAAAVVALGLGTLFAIEARFAAAGATPGEEPAPGMVEAAPAEGGASAAPGTEALTAPETAEAEEAAEEIAAAAGPPPQWTIAPGGSLRFVAENAGAALTGSFSSWSGRIVMDPERPETADLRIDVRLSSATLGDATQDEMLASGDFFGVDANPVATWRSDAVRRVGPGRYEADGTLSLKGASRPQRIVFTLSGNGARRQVSGSASIDRTAFGVGTGPNAASLASTVRVEFAFDASS